MKRRLKPKPVLPSPFIIDSGGVNLAVISLTHQAFRVKMIATGERKVTAGAGLTKMAGQQTVGAGAIPLRAGVYDEPRRVDSDGLREH